MWKTKAEFVRVVSLPGPEGTFSASTLDRMLRCLREDGCGISGTWEQLPLGGHFADLEDARRALEELRHRHETPALPPLMPADAS
jgi:hypothetical protein